MKIPVTTERIVYPPVGECIYCGDRSDPSSLTLEHIIPFGLGGRLELPAASCQRCANNTHAFEGHCLGGMFESARSVIGIRSRKRGRIGEIAVDIEGNTPDRRRVKVAADIFPHRAYMPILFPAGCLHGLPASSDLMWSMRVIDLVDNIKTRTMVAADMAPGKAVYLSGSIGVIEFAQMLAKIAHAYAAALKLFPEYYPTLLRLLRQKNEVDVQQFVGTSQSDENKSNNLHEIDWGTRAAGRWTFLVVRIRLLAALGFPSHYVVAGAKV